MPPNPGLRPLIIVGSFPAPGSAGISGGVHTSCQALLAAGIGQRFDLHLVDTSQPMNPPPSLLWRVLGAARRVRRFVAEVRRVPRPASALIFLSEGLSFIEKACLARIATSRGLLVAVAPRGGAVREQLERRASMRVAAHAMFAHVDWVLCQGASWIETFRPYTGADGDARLVPLMNWTASSNMLALGAARLIEPPMAVSGSLSVLYSGTLLERKGVFEMLDGIALARVTQPGITLRIAGDGTDEARLRDHATALGLDGAVRWLGWVDGEAKQAAFAGADCLCLVSHSEGMPNAVIEAMAAALPVVVTPVGGVPDAAPREAGGVHVPLRDPAALADALIRLAIDVEGRRYMGERAHHRAAEHFTASGALDTLVRLLDPEDTTCAA